VRTTGPEGLAAEAEADAEGVAECEATTPEADRDGVVSRVSADEHAAMSRAPAERKVRMLTL
jgi:hypothetical protein